MKKVTIKATMTITVNANDDVEMSDVVSDVAYNALACNDGYDDAYRIESATIDNYEVLAST